MSCMHTEIQSSNLWTYFGHHICPCKQLLMICVCFQAELQYQQIHDVDKDEEAQTLLGDDGPRFGQAMRLG